MSTAQYNLPRQKLLWVVKSVDYQLSLLYMRLNLTFVIFQEGSADLPVTLRKILPPTYGSTYDFPATIPLFS